VCRSQIQNVLVCRNIKKFEKRWRRVIAQCQFKTAGTGSHHRVSISLDRFLVFPLSEVKAAVVWCFLYRTRWSTSEHISSFFFLFLLFCICLVIESEPELSVAC